MFNHLDGIRKVMIVDLDAHQGNGHERDFLHDNRVYILDCYNKWIYPNDKPAKGRSVGVVIRVMYICVHGLVFICDSATCG